MRNIGCDSRRSISHTVIRSLRGSCKNPWVAIHEQRLSSTALLQRTTRLRLYQPSDLVFVRSQSRILLGSIKNSHPWNSKDFFPRRNLQIQDIWPTYRHWKPSSLYGALGDPWIKANGQLQTSPRLPSVLPRSPLRHPHPRPPGV